MRRVTAAVIVENGHLLLARRGPGEKLEGQWELPGGKIEPGETPQRCLERELLEELGMSVVANGVLADTVYEYDHGCFELLAVAAVRLSEYAPTVHDSVRWIRPEDLKGLPVAPADIQLLNKITALGVW